MLRFKLNCSVMLVLPRKFCELMESSPAMVENCFSSGKATAAAIVSELAPGRLALTLIVGFAGAGLSLTATSGTALPPPSRWPILVVGMMLLLSVAYRYGPCRRVAKWRWVTWGASASAAIWLAGSALLSLYAAHFTHLNPLLGSLGSVMIFLFWCYLTVLTVLFGAHINAELERHAGEIPAKATQPA